MLSKSPPAFVHVTNFAVNENAAFVSDCTPPKIIPIGVARMAREVPEITEIRPEFLHWHYPTGVHDATILALESTIRSGDTLSRRLGGFQVVCDRRPLRKLMLNKCVSLPTNPFYCEPKAFSMMAEKRDGTLFLYAHDTDSAHPGGYGLGFQMIMSESTKPYPESYFELVEMKLDDAMNILCRQDIDAVDEDGRSVKFKCRKWNFEYPPTADFYLNIWIQMALSDMSMVRIGQHRNGELFSVEDHSFSDIQALAGISPDAAQNSFSNLAQALKEISSLVKEEEQATLHCSASGAITVDFPLPIISPAVRSKLLPASTD